MNCPGQALVVEDHPLYRDALSHLLRPFFGDERTLRASTAEEGMRIARDTNDLRLVLLDMGLPGISGSEAIKIFRKLCPAATLLVVSASDDRRDVAAALSSGATLFVSKALPSTMLINAVERVLSGQISEPEWVTPTGSLAVTSSNGDLTTRQCEILELLAKGLSNKDIGLRLSIAEITVKMHVSSIFRVLGVANRTQAVLAARRLGLTSIDPP